jgi:hypothetical protein
MQQAMKTITAPFGEGKLSYITAERESRKGSILMAAYDGRYPYLSQETLDTFEELLFEGFCGYPSPKNQYYQDFFGEIRRCIPWQGLLTRSFEFSQFLNLSSDYQSVGVAVRVDGYLYYPHWIWFEVLSSMGFSKFHLARLYRTIVKMFQENNG